MEIRRKSKSLPGGNPSAAPFFDNAVSPGVAFTRPTKFQEGSHINLRLKKDLKVSLQRIKAGG